MLYQLANDPIDVIGAVIERCRPPQTSEPAVVRAYARPEVAIAAVIAAICDRQREVRTLFTSDDLSLICEMVDVLTNGIRWVVLLDPGSAEGTLFEGDPGVMASLRAAPVLGAPVRRGRAPKWLRDDCKARPGKCVYCEAVLATQLDHLVAVACGGSNSPLNFVGACPACNIRKRVRPVAPGAFVRTPQETLFQFVRSSSFL